ncbi:MAG: peptidase M48 [Acidobacteria bacterium]|nr:MAG: peptidase M48 [Acidobacteriota bacterium]
MRGNRVILTVVFSLGFFVFARQEIIAKQKNSDIENIGNRNVNARQINFMSLEKEIALGRQLAQEVERTSKLLRDQEISEYVNRLGQNIVRNSDAKVPFVIKVLESDEINAMALPGGFFYVNSGLILAANEEAELAGVMAHEIAHVAARHGTEQYSKGQLFNIASIPLIFLGGPIGYGIRQAAGFLIPLQFLQFSRGAEREADFLGLQYLYKTGYDPTAYISFFEKVQAQDKKKPGLLAKAFSTHPPTEDRITKSQKEIQELLAERQEYVLNTSEFDHIKARLTAYENAKKPAVDDLKSQRPVLKRKTSGEVDDSDESTDSPVDQDRPKLTRKQANWKRN